MDKRRSYIFYTVGALLTVWISVESIFLMVYRETWFDELVYLFKGYAVVTGVVMPFRDVLLEYPPLAFFVHGLVQAFSGPSIMAGRITSGVFFAVLLALTFVIAKRLGGRWAGIGAVALVMSHVLLVANYISAVPYALAMVCLLGAFAIEFSSYGRNTKVFWAALFLAWMMLTRINMLPAVMIYGAYLFWIRALSRHHVIFWSVFFSALIFGYMPVILPDPLLAISSTLNPFARFGPFAALPASAKVGSVEGEKFLEILASFFREYAATLAFFFAMVLAIVSGGRRALKDFLAREPEFALVIIMAVGLLAAHYFYWRISGSIQYANFFMPLVALAVVVGAGRVVKDHRVASVMILALIGVNLVANAFPSSIISRPDEETDLQRIKRGALFLASHTTPRDRIIAFDNSIFHVFSAGRLTEPALMNRDFTYVGAVSGDVARRLRMYNPEILLAWLADADVAVVHEERWPQTFRRPFWKGEYYDSEKIITDVSSYLGQHYDLVGKALNVYPRKYTQGNDGGTLVLYRRKK